MANDSGLSMIDGFETADSTPSGNFDDAVKTPPSDSTPVVFDQASIGQIVHDLRNIATVITGNLALLEICNFPGAEEMLKRANKGTDRLSTVIATLSEMRRSLRPFDDTSR